MTLSDKNIVDLEKCIEELGCQYLETTLAYFNINPEVKHIQGSIIGNSIVSFIMGCNQLSKQKNSFAEGVIEHLNHKLKEEAK